MRLWALLALTLLTVTSTRAQTIVPYTDENPVAADPLTRAIVEAFREAELGPDTKLALFVSDADRGQTWLQINPDAPLRPASVLKLVTAAAALDLLGPDRRFETTVETSAPLVDGVLAGDLVIRGGGDPSLGPRFHERRGEITGLLREWARELRSEGIRTIRGNIVGDATRYAHDPHAIGWEPLEYGEWYSAEVSALSFNENTVDLIWRGGRRAGARASYTLRPDSGYVTVSNSVRTSAGSSPNARVRHFRFRDSNEIRARGSLPPGESRYHFASVHDPARFTAHLLREELLRRGVDVRGSAVNARQLDIGGPPPARQPVAGGDEQPPGNEEGLAPAGPRVLIRHQSPPLSEFLPIILGDSQNLYAEMMLREVALESGQPATFLDGTSATTRWMRANNLNYPGFTMVDGSGLSPLNRMPARVAVRTLRHLYNGPHRGMVMEGLATPGTRSLRSRFQEEQYQALQENLWAKTGFIDGTHAMAGYLRKPSGRTYTFTIMLNDYDLPLSLEARDFLDRTVLRLYESSYLP